jgi:hypothetical protein
MNFLLQLTSLAGAVGQVSRAVDGSASLATFVTIAEDCGVSLFFGPKCQGQRVARTDLLNVFGAQPAFVVSFLRSGHEFVRPAIGAESDKAL